MNWQQKIETQIAMHRAGELCMPDVCRYRPTGCPCTDTADAMQALLDVAVAADAVNAEAWAADAGGYDPAWLDVEDALDKLREMDDHNPRGEDCFCPVCTGVL